MDAKKKAPLPIPRTDIATLPDRILSKHDHRRAWEIGHDDRVGSTHYRHLDAEVTTRARQRRNVAPPQVTFSPPRVHLDASLLACEFLVLVERRDFATVRPHRKVL